jgi:hypothetical protein
MASEDFNPEQMTDEQLRAAYEAEIKKVRVEFVLLENVVTLINLGMRRTGLMPGTEDEFDLDQVAVAIESVRGVMPIIEQISPEQATAIADALSQLQMAYVQATSQGGAPPAPAGGSGGPAGGEPAAPGDPAGPASEDGAPSGEPIPPGEPGPAIIYSAAHVHPDRRLWARRLGSCEASTRRRTRGVRDGSRPAFPRAT